MRPRDVLTAGLHRMQHAPPIALLLVSNVFMTVAWYGHLRFADRPLLAVILIS